MESDVNSNVHVYLDSHFLHEFNINEMWLQSIRPMSMYTQTRLDSCPISDPKTSVCYTRYYQGGTKGEEGI